MDKQVTKQYAFRPKKGHNTIKPRATNSKEQDEIQLLGSLELLQTSQDAIAAKREMTKLKNKLSRLVYFYNQSDAMSSTECLYRPFEFYDQQKQQSCQLCLSMVLEETYSLIHEKRFSNSINKRMMENNQLLMQIFNSFSMEYQETKAKNKRLLR